MLHFRQIGTGRLCQSGSGTGAFRKLQLKIDAGEEGLRTGGALAFENGARLDKSTSVKGSLAGIRLGEGQGVHSKKNGHFAQHTAC